MGDYGVSIIRINSSTIAISIIEPQNDADTFINSCGETGERPAIRVMITINDVWITAKLSNDINQKVSIDISYTDNSDGYNINVYDIIFAVVKPKVDDIKTNAALDVLHGLNRFVVDNGIRLKSYIDVIDAASNCAKDKELSLIEYLVKYANR